MALFFQCSTSLSIFMHVYIRYHLRNTLKASAMTLSITLTYIASVLPLKGKHNFFFFLVVLKSALISYIGRHFFSMFNQSVNFYAYTVSSEEYRRRIKLMSLQCHFPVLISLALAYLTNLPPSYDLELYIRLVMVMYTVFYYVQLIDKYILRWLH